MSASLSPAKQEHAIVMGGSMAGLLAARVLAKQFERVTLLERDQFPDRPGPRKGLPQARHIHVLLATGRQALEQLLPGLITDLVAAGASNHDAIADVKWISPGGLCPRYPSPIPMLVATRDLIDGAIRGQLRGVDQLRIRMSMDVTGLRLADGNNRVTGVMVTDRTSGDTENLDADLVVDAGGRGSRTPQWLEALGYHRPRETVINGFLGYASRLVQFPADWRTEWKVFYIQCAPPVRKRGGAIAAVEDGKWIVTLLGGGKDYPPSDEQGFLKFARSLPDPQFAQVYEAATPLTPIAVTRSTENRLRHYEALRRRPEGLLIIGDAACSFNPVYGQGMSAAAMGAVLLADCLRRWGNNPGLAARFQSKLAKKNARPWLLATGEDYRYEETQGPKPSLATHLTHRYLDRLMVCATNSPVVHQRMVEVLHLLRSPLSLFAPQIVTSLWGTSVRCASDESERLQE